MRDGSCRASGCREQLYVVEWYKANDMSQYNTGLTATLDDTAMRFFCAPIYISLSTSPASPSHPSWPPTAVCDLLRICLNGLEHIYHDRELHPGAVGMAEVYLDC
jgi:hypothetical protein